MCTWRFLEPRWQEAANSISTSLLVALKIAGRLEGAMIALLAVSGFAVAVNDLMD